MTYKVYASDYTTQTNKCLAYIIKEYAHELQYPENYHMPYFTSIRDLWYDKLNIKIEPVQHPSRDDILVFNSEEDFLLWAVKFS